jgi:hypothetical protein
MRRRLAPIVFVTMSLAGTLPVPAAAQITRGERPIASIDPRPESPPGQISSQERRAWMAEQILAPKGLGAGLATAAWQTAIDSPREWSGPSAFSQRFLSNEADIVISTSIEAGLGALWHEDPRSRPSGRQGVGSRLLYAMTTVVVAPRPDGHAAPAWGRFAGVVGGNVAMNAWLPSRHTTFKDTAGRVAGTFLSRLGANLWTEFGPDVRRRFARGADRESKPVVRSTAEPATPVLNGARPFKDQ